MEPIWLICIACRDPCAVCFEASSLVSFASFPPGTDGAAPAKGMFGGTPRVLASSVVWVVTLAMFWDSPILMRLCTSSWALLKGIAAIASHSCWTSCAIVFASILALTTVASMARSFPAIAAACAALAS